MKEYESMHLVKGEDLNHHGTLFAARAAAWFVEAGFAAAACEHGNPDEIALRNVHSMSFQKPVEKGAVVRFCGRVVCLGRSSIIVNVMAVNALTGVKSVDGFITFVTVDQTTRQKKAHGLTLDEPTGDGEQEIREAALRIKQG